MTREEFIKSRDEKLKQLPKIKPGSKTESEFLAAAEKNGLLVTKIKHPIFILWANDGKLSLILVRPNAKEKFTSDLGMLMAYLRFHRVACYVWSPDKDWFGKKKKHGGRSK